MPVASIPLSEIVFHRSDKYQAIPEPLAVLVSINRLIKSLFIVTLNSSIRCFKYWPASIFALDSRKPTLFRRSGGYFFVSYCAPQSSSLQTLLICSIAFAAVNLYSVRNKLYTDTDKKDIVLYYCYYLLSGTLCKH